MTRRIGLGAIHPGFNFHCTRLTVVRFQNVSSALPAITLKGSCASSQAQMNPSLLQTRISCTLHRTRPRVRLSLRKAA